MQYHKKNLLVTFKFWRGYRETRISHYCVEKTKKSSTQTRPYINTNINTRIPNYVNVLHHPKARTNLVESIPDSESIYAKAKFAMI